MAISKDQFKQGMRRLGGAVNIVTAADGEVWAGLTATAVTSLSAEPPRLLACINRQGVTYDIVSKGRTLGVNVLGTAHKALAMRFAGMDGEGETERFDGGSWFTAKSGAPLLTGALVSFDCTVESILDAGSHAIVIGNIEAVKVGAGDTLDPLCYLDGEWGTFQPLV
ncbi:MULTISPECIES: flavin reductase family protein [Kordiimonas]|jgi:flavin reductase (DIM6/NTAB) family NADH-FMN oxidoreductase RutF|uniref:flavin reductase family protein n=1 Tax=Kordiimonas TaxID=288021 RepID=UPI002579C2FA|nr:flavin reductase family protein [Kordiimonas sp. UBA4487]